MTLSPFLLLWVFSSGLAVLVLLALLSLLSQALICWYQPLRAKPY
jgi:hypothetical protein